MNENIQRKATIKKQLNFLPALAEIACLSSIQESSYFCEQYQSVIRSTKQRTSNHQSSERVFVGPIHNCFSLP